ncbi:TRAP-type mannitol/chloroaromatic compound transport system, small permease component [Hahella chejuensis KCTC 2396]|uniref:TRAP transporter small permease protein n=1 Tax=Hahella chejuensis (strain KCTC 2396) TaxID=349521 RepID=Q2SPU8_HAHCH|nr:TRAP transporter small permease subunit [Hahella chejuensis]ABC27326.1 TRAP-type mannitol/chloroaromatic compound transport system, small permease component [Hahella chejuensis KCTC 2396]
MQWIKFFDRLFERASHICGLIAAGCFLLMLVNVFYDVVMRYLFNQVSIGMQELEWHLFAAVFLLGVPYALRTDGHVRVDVLYEGWSDRLKAIVNMVGAIAFVTPFSLLVMYFGFGFTVDAFNLMEGSGDPGGLPYRWIIKSLIPLSSLLILLSGLGMITQALRVLLLGEKYAESHAKEGLA